MLDVAQDAAKAAGKIALAYFSKTQKIEYKSDNSPVTIADREAEKAARAVIAKKFPDHGIIGEELGITKSSSKYQWTIDPIDGTKSYVRGLPFWSVLIALLEENQPILGVSFAPALSEMLLAKKGGGTYLNGKKTHVSKVSNIKQSYLSHGSLKAFEEKSRVKNLLNVIRSTNSHRGSPDTYAYHLLIKGNIDILIEARDKIHDIAAPALLVEEAGGKFTNFEGKFSITDDCAFATNGILHKEALKIFNTR